MPRRPTSALAARSVGVTSVPRIGGNFLRELADEESTTGLVARFGAGLGEDPHPSWVLNEKSSATQRVGEFYDEMLDKDPDLTGAFEKRYRSVLTLPSRIVAADGTPAAKEAAELVAGAVGRIENWMVTLEHQLSAVPRGVAFDEILWERATDGPVAGAWVPKDIIDRPMHRFLFRSGELHIRRALSQEPIVAPPGKILRLSRGTKDNPWGKALLDRCYWPWFLKKNAIKFYAVFLDKFGQPTAVGKYKHTKDEKTNKENQRRLHEAIQAIQTEYGVTIPENLAIEFLEAARSGNVTYEQFIAMFTRAMLVLVLGEVDTSGAAKGPGSFAKSEVSDGVRFETTVLDGRMLSGNVRAGLFAPIVALNLGPGVPVPRLEIETIEAEDREERRKGIELAQKLKLSIPERYARQTTQVPAPENGEPVVEAAPDPPPAPPGAPPPDPGDDPPAPKPKPGKDEPPLPPRKTTKLSDDPKLLAQIEKRSKERSGEFDQVASWGAGFAVDYYGGWKRELLAAWDDGEVAGGTALRRLVGRVNPLDHARALHTAQIHASGLTLQHLGEDLPGGTAILSVPPGWDGATTPGSAIDFWSSLLQINKGAFTALTDASRRFAFTVAGVNDMTLLSEIHSLLGQAIVGGWPRREFVSQLEELFTKRGLEPLSRWHAELVFANNVRQVAGLLKYQQLVENDRGRRLMPYLMWVNNFSRSGPRDRHALMGGYVAAAGHEIWKTWWIPAGHHCVCDVVGINLAKAKRLGYTGAEPVGQWPLFEGSRVMPDPGFAGAPNLDGTADELETEADGLIEQARREGDPDLLEALLQLFVQLLGSFADSVGLAEFVALPKNR